MRLSTVCPAPAGSVLIRDVRAWHGGTPNLTDATRSIPNLEFTHPGFVNKACRASRTPTILNSRNALSISLDFALQIRLPN